MRGNMKTKQIDALKQISKWLIILGLAGGVWLKLIYTQLSTKINKVPAFSQVNVTMFFLALVSIGIIYALVVAIGGKHTLKLAWVVSVFFSVLMFADTVYGRYYYNPITMSILHQLNMADDVSGSALSLLKIKDIIFILDYVVIIPLVLLLKRQNVWVDIKFSRIRLILGLLAMVVFSGIFYQGYQGMNIILYNYERKYIARDLGLIAYHTYDLKQYLEKLGGDRKLSEDEVALIESVNGTGSISGPLLGSASGYNLIVVQVEAMMSYLIDYEVNGEAVTPFLNQLKNKSYYFDNCYFQTANGNTVDAELMMNTSLLPTKVGSTYYEYPTNTYDSLPILLESMGYTSNSFHGYEASFWNREIMHKTLGFDRFYSLDDFDVKEKVGWAISDVNFFDEAMDMTREASHNYEQPFYSFFITLSSHHPYDAFMEGPFTDESTQSSLTNRYYNSIHYADQAIESLFDRLEQDGLLDHTLVLIYGDHGGLFADDAIDQVTRDGLTYNAYTWMQYQQVPAMLVVPGLEEGITSSKAVGQLDFLPTVAYLMGLDLPYVMGHNMLMDEGEHYVVKRFGDVVTDTFTYISDEGQFYDTASGEVIIDGRYEEALREAYHQLEAVDLIYESDYFDHYYKDFAQEK